MLVDFDVTGDGLFHWKKFNFGLWNGNLAGSDGLKLKHLKDGLVLWVFHFTIH